MSEDIIALCQMHHTGKRKSSPLHLLDIQEINGKKLEEEQTPMRVRFSENVHLGEELKST